MSDKIKACCENCEYYTGKQCDSNGNWHDECSLYANFCSQPCEDFEKAKKGRLKKRIAELEAENAELKTRVQQFEHKEICVKETAEKLDAKESEAKNG